MFSVELLPDETLDRAVRDDWTRLVDAGLPSSGRHTAPSNRPHVTVAVRERLAPPALADLAALAEDLPLSVELSGLLLFGGAPRLVLTRHVVASMGLLEFHRRVAELVGPPEARYTNTAPDRWSPHMTLARRLDADQLSSALRAVQAPFVSGELTGLRVWDASAKEVTTLR